MESVSSVSSFLESTRDLTLEAAREASLFRNPRVQQLRTPDVRKLLESRHEREVLDGLRHVIAVSHRPPIPSGPPLLFSSVVKNIANPSNAVKKLVYIYLLRYAESEPDTALLSINTIQKTLSAPDPHLRALALRVMSGIRVPVISQIVSLAIKKGCADMSPLVRKAAALAIPKCWRLDPAGTAPQMEEYLNQLLGDRQYYVAGAAVVSFMEVCPDRFDLIHKHYRSLVRKLVDMDEWGQLATLRLMLFYVRRCFPQRSRRVKKGTVNAKAAVDVKEFYAEDDSDDDGSDTAYEEVPVQDPDITLLLDSAQPLLQSRNSAVIVAVTRLYLYLTPTPPPASTSSHVQPNTYLLSTIGPLIALLRSPSDIVLPALHNITRIALLHPRPFIPYATHFLLRAADPPPVRRLKLELLVLVFPHAPHTLQSLILREATHASAAPRSTADANAASSSADANSAALIRDAVRAVGRCAQAGAGGGMAARCMRLLLANLGSSNDVLVAESLTVIRHLIQAEPGAHVGTVTRLAKGLDATTHPGARASIIWLVGEFAGLAGGDNVAADVLRILAKTFTEEHEAAKLQIVLLAAKVYVHYLNGLSSTFDPTTASGAEVSQGNAYHQEGDQGYPSTQDGAAGPRQDAIENHPIPKLYNYILLLTRYDTSYDLRDRARLYRSLLSSPSSTQLASLLLLAPKPVPSVPSPVESRKDFTLGSASLVIGADEAGLGGLPGYEPVPEWIEPGKEPDPKLRGDDRAGPPVYDDQVVKVAASARLDVKTREFDVIASEDNSHSGIRQPQITEKSLDDWLAEDDAEEHEADNDGIMAEDEDEEEGEEETESEEETEDESNEESEASDNGNDEAQTFLDPNSKGGFK